MSATSPRPDAALAVPAATPAGDAPAAVPKAGARLVALDAWRGLTVLLMLLVNNVALDWRTPRQLVHAPWGGGVTLADLVFPWFLFCAGTAIPLSVAASRRAGTPTRALLGRLAARTVSLSLVGCLLVSAVNHAFTLGLGVLQLIALASFVGTLAGFLSPGARLVLAGGLLGLYAALLHLYPLADGTVGAFEETRNAIAQLNATVLGPLGLRGLASVVPTAALVMLGSVAGEWTRGDTRLVLGRLLGFGAVLTGLGLAWGEVLFVNKPLWTPPYILLGAGLGTLGLLACFLVERALRRPALLTPLVVAGRNALLAYVAPILFKTWILQDWRVDWTGKTQSIQAALLDSARHTFGPWNGGWLYTLGYVGATWLLLWWMYRRGRVWKV